jgi:hypothetical protein
MCFGFSVDKVVAVRGTCSENLLGSELLRSLKDRYGGRRAGVVAGEPVWWQKSRSGGRRAAEDLEDDHDNRMEMLKTVQIDQYHNILLNIHTVFTTQAR